MDRPRRPIVFGFHTRRDRARHAAPRDANARRGGRRAQFQLWIFSYQILRSLANLMLSRLNLGVALALIISGIIHARRRLARPHSRERGWRRRGRSGYRRECRARTVLFGLMGRGPRKAERMGSTQASACE